MCCLLQLRSTWAHSCGVSGTRITQLSTGVHNANSVHLHFLASMAARSVMLLNYSMSQKERFRDFYIEKVQVLYTKKMNY